MITDSAAAAGLSSHLTWWRQKFWGPFLGRQVTSARTAVTAFKG